MKFKQNLRKRLSPQDLQRLIVALGVTDVQVRYSPSLQRWQLWQVRTAPILVPGQPKTKGALMWTIEEPDNGAYRDPMVMDLERMRHSLENYKLLQKIGPKAYADRMDVRDKAREKRVSPKSDDRIKQGAKELAAKLYKDQNQVHFGGSK